MKTVLLGMNNPISQLPKYALYPLPEGCTGNRIFKMLTSRMPGVDYRAYCDGFDRRNILVGKWSKALAHEALYEWGVIDKLQGREVIVLGREAQAVLRLDKEWILPQERHGVTWRPIPHPSGLNQWYNDVENRDKVALLLEECYRRGQE